MKKGSQLLSFEYPDELCRHFASRLPAWVVICRLCIATKAGDSHHQLAGQAVIQTQNTFKLLFCFEGYQPHLVSDQRVLYLLLSFKTEEYESGKEGLCVYILLQNLAVERIKSQMGF